MSWTKKAHAALPTEKQLMPATDVSIKVDLKSQALYTDCHVENCLTLEVVVCLQNPSRLRFTASIVEGMRWLVRRTLDFQMWPFLHALHGKPATGKGRWHVLRSFIALKRRIQSNAYSLNDAVRMRINCKEYIRLYKKKFNGPQSAFQWRRALPPLTAEDATTLGLIELSYPADKLVNFRMMAQTEMKTETSMNSFADEGTLGDIKRSPRSQLSWQVRELTPMEQLHLHGQHGFGTNIFRGLPPPPSNLKVRIDVVAPVGLWWVCNLGADEQSWAVAVDLARQPVRLLLVDSISDNSVFATLEAPRAQQKDRPLALLLGRSEAAFRQGSAGRGASGGEAGHGGTGREEWCSLLEFDGTVCCWGQVKTVPVSASHSPWDIFASFSCGQGLRRKKDTSFGRVTPLEELLGRSVPMCSTDSGNSEDACLRLNLPLRLPSGQEGPFVGLLKWSLAGNAPARSGLASLAGLARSGYDLAALRLHTSLPPLQLQGLSQDSPLRLPGFDAACHLENGGLVDGFVIGLHNLYNFANLLVAMPVAKKPQAANSVPASAQRRPSPAVQPLSLPLEQAPPMLVTVGAMLAAGAVVLAGGRQMSEEPSDQPSPELVNVAEEQGLTGMVHTDEPSDPMAGITLIPTLLAVLVGRRALWDRLQQKDDGDASEVFKFFAAMLQVLLAMGFPVHRCCLPLAAWVGSLELLQVLSQRGGEKEFSRLGGVDNLLSWAARGIYSQPKAQSEVLEWLCNQKADPNHRDAAGRSVLDWACWAGCEELVSMLLRRGRMATREPEVQPLLLATSSRSVGLVRLLLRAAGDPHALPRGQSDAGHACGALLLAVRCCEYELACEMLKSAAFVNVDLALGASPRRERGAAQDEEKPAGAATRATIVLVESLRRFCSGLQRRSVEEVSVTGVRTHVPGPHPDECLYATPTMPLGDVLHPLAAQLPSPMHRVPLELRPGVLPMAWLRRTREEPWTSARMMVECFLQRGFKADEAFLTKVMPALPPEVQNLTRRLAEGGYPPPLPTLLTTMPDMRRASVTEKSPTTMCLVAQRQDKAVEDFCGAGEGLLAAAQGHGGREAVHRQCRRLHEGALEPRAERLGGGGGVTAAGHPRGGAGRPPRWKKQRGSGSGGLFAGALRGGRWACMAAGGPRALAYLRLSSGAGLFVGYHLNLLSAAVPGHGSGCSHICGGSGGQLRIGGDIGRGGHGSEMYVHRRKRVSAQASLGGGELL
ncbi:unnamed protein product [Effrenium voratum]|nr:unnamed protein product [Effrenium voratum]